MYIVIVSPLSQVVADGEEDLVAAKEFVEVVQKTLGQAAGHPVVWEETPDPDAELMADEMDPFCLHGLRAAAIYVEQHGSLEGFDPGPEPWDHEVFDAAEKAGGSKKFPQLAHGEADLLAYVPAELDDCYRLTPVTEPDEGEDEELNEGEIAVGSLPALMRELKTMREALGLPDEPEIDDELMDENSEDPLVDAKVACVVLSSRAAEASKEGTPLLVLWDEDAMEEALAEDGEGGEAH